MSQRERLYKLGQWLAAGRRVTPVLAHAELEVSASTVKRDMAYLGWAG